MAKTTRIPLTDQKLFSSVANAIPVSSGPTGIPIWDPNHTWDPVNRTHKIQLQSGQLADASQILDFSENKIYSLNKIGQITHDYTAYATGNSVEAWNLKADSGPKLNHSVESFGPQTYNGNPVPPNAVISIGWNVVGGVTSEDPNYYYTRIAIERGWVWVNGGGPGNDIWQTETHFGAVGNATSNGDRIRAITSATRLDGTYKTYVGVQCNNFYIQDDSAASGNLLFQLTGGVNASNITTLTLLNGDAQSVGYPLAMTGGATADVLNIGRSNTTENRIAINLPVGANVAANLYVGSSTGILATHNGSKGSIQCYTGVLTIQTMTASAMQFGTNNGSYFYMDASGNIGMGSNGFSTPASRLHIDNGQLRLSYSSAGDIITSGVNTRGILLTVSQSVQGIEWEADTFGSGYGFRARTNSVGGVTYWYLDSRQNSTTFTPIFLADSYQQNFGFGTKVDTYTPYRISASGKIGFVGNDSASNQKPQGYAIGVFADATDATFKGQYQLFAADFTGVDREGFRVSSDGTQPLISFYGGTAVPRQLLATGAGHTVDDVITFLQTVNICRQA